MDANPPEIARELGDADKGSLIARSDNGGFITYVNDALAEASGYRREELIGKHFRTLYHPDMPPALLEAMKLRLKQGLPWIGIIKNLSKDGGHFWVNARVVPVRKNGEDNGFVTVSDKLSGLSHDDIDRAEKSLLAADTSGTRSGSRNWKSFLSVKNGVSIGIVFVTLMVIAGGILGIGGLHLSSQAMHTIYYEEMEPVRAIGRINFLMSENRAQISLALHHNPATHKPAEFDHSASAHLAAVEKNSQEIESLWTNYSKLPRGGLERQLSEDYWDARSH